MVDVAPCLAAANADIDDKVDANCPAVIDNEKTAESDRLKALIARGDYYVRRGMTDRAIADYSQALLLDPSLADIYNARGELWLRTYDRP
ncbi:tetratricopeptide repeat protein, partial [Streptomyces galilaeus]|uniref:tetratricopeptide repeat protein n=1 Tax=Streptomyces galilaeus TaxID=33899 RepID=UPI0038F769EA